MCPSVEKSDSGDRNFCVHNVLKTLCWCWCVHGSHGLVNGAMVEFKPGDGTILRFVPHKEMRLDNRTNKAAQAHQAQAKKRSGPRRKTASESLKDRADAALKEIS